jgi:hypothetical protein
MHIPILPVEEIDAAKPDYIFILPWNLKRFAPGYTRCGSYSLSHRERVGVRG